jgi:MbtH protein
MTDEENREDSRIYEVVRNGEGQYSIYPQDRTPPAGWSLMGKAGTEDECVSYIDEVWTDMTPLSVKRMLTEQARQRP